jgi:hypothetical protein
LSVLALTLGFFAWWAVAQAAPAAALPSNCSQSANTVTCSYTGAGTDTFTVPAGVSHLDVTAVGAAGGMGPGTGFPLQPAPGGPGASVEDTAVPVSSSQDLSVVIGSVGADGAGAAGGSGGSPGGGSGSNAANVFAGGGGGGYSGLFDPSSSPLVIAAGGGGSGGGGGGGGAGDSDGGNGPGIFGGGGGGFAGTSSGGGAGGTGQFVGQCGTPTANGSGGGSLTGGPGGFGNGGGGGGGGGYFGGGGGGYGGTFLHNPGGGFTFTERCFGGGGGGGAGSSFIEPSALDPSITPDTTGTPSVSIAPAIRQPTASIKTHRATVRSGKTRMRIACSGAAVTTCRGWLSLTITRRVRHPGVVVFQTVTIARARYSLASGHTKLVVLRLNAAALRLMASAPNHRLNARTSATLQAGVTVSAPVKLRE